MLALRGLISQIFVVDQQCRAILRYGLGLYPVSGGVVKDSKDFGPSDSQADGGRALQGLDHLR